MIKMSHKDW